MKLRYLYTQLIKDSSNIILGHGTAQTSVQLLKNMELGF